MKKGLQILCVLTIAVSMLCMNSYVIHAEDEIEVTSIELTTMPNHLHYLQNVDEYNAEYGRLTVTYSNGKNEIIRLNKANISGFDNTKLGIQTLTVEYGGQTTTYDVTIYGDGNNVGEVVIEGVTRLYGENRFQTSIKIAEEFRKLSEVYQLQSVVVANGYNFADALSGAYLANKRNGILVIIPKGPIANAKGDYNFYYSMRNYVLSNTRNDAKQYFLGGVNVIDSAYWESSSGLASTSQRLAGNSRYDTNLEILKTAGIENEPILVATGKNYADSLSASATNLPVLLVDEKLSNNQKELLSNLNGNKMYILGGTSAVNSNIENELKEYGEVERLAGKDRYETSVLIAETFFENPKYAVLAYGNNFPDGLSGGTLAYKIGGPLLLINNEYVNTIAEYTNKYGIENGYVLGGPGLISNDTVSKVFKQEELESTEKLSLSCPIFRKEDFGTKWFSFFDAEGDPYLFENEEDMRIFLRKVSNDPNSVFYGGKAFGYHYVFAGECSTGFKVMQIQLEIDGKLRFKTVLKEHVGDFFE